MAMKCPTCDGVDLLMADRQGIEIDYCPNCRGVWLDHGELDKIIERTHEEYERVFEPMARLAEQVAAANPPVAATASAPLAGAVPVTPADPCAAPMPICAEPVAPPPAYPQPVPAAPAAPAVQTPAPQPGYAPPPPQVAPQPGYAPPAPGYAPVPASGHAPAAPGYVPAPAYGQPSPAQAQPQQANLMHAAGEALNAMAMMKKMKGGTGSGGKKTGLSSLLKGL